MSGIILCATQRCGSTMVLEDMRNTGIMGNPEEYFIPWEKDLSIDQIKLGIDSIKARSATSNGIYSIKIMANQLPYVEKKLSILYGFNSNNFTAIRKCFSDCKFVLIKRDSLVRQAISRAMARQTGVNHATKNATDDHFAGNLLKGYDESYNRSVKYDKAQIENEIMNITRENGIWEQFFQKVGILSPLTLRYEEIVKNYPGYIKKMCQYAGIKQDWTPSNRSMVKLSNGKNEDWFMKFINDV